MIIGFHLSIAGGLANAVAKAEELGCGALQIFCRNPRSWSVKELAGDEVSAFRAARRSAGLAPVVVHTTYLINLSSPDDALFERSLDLFIKELQISEAIGADYLVTHMGSSTGSGDGFAYGRICSALTEIASAPLERTTTILFENTAGGGASFGSNITDIGRVMDYGERIGLTTGLCYDTCHGFAAGYKMNTAKDVDTLINILDFEAGLERLKLIHMNDSKGELASRLDRHEHIGEGKIGLDGFEALVNHPSVASLPFILETPKKNATDDERNFRTVRKLRRKW